MDELNNQDPVEEVIEEEELGLTDKIVGIFTEPQKTFINVSKYPLKTTDWFLPLFLASLFSLLSVIIMFTDESIKYDFEEKASVEIEKSINKQIESGKITEEQAEMGREMGLKWGKIMTYITKFIGLWFILFFSALIYWLIIKFGFKDQGTYKEALVSLGLPFYILMLQSILTLIIAFLTKQYMNTPNLAEILGMDIRQFPDVLMSFVDIFMIWYFIVVSIGLSILFKSTNTIKYYALTFGVWIGLSLLFFGISQ